MKMKDSTVEKLVKWGLIGLGSLIAGVGAAVKMKPDKPEEAVSGEVIGECEVSDVEVTEEVEEG